MKQVVFLGPTLPRERMPAANAAFEIRPPAAQGDVLRALAAGATHLGIVDGFFDQVPSVWHKEILFAIEQGAVVYGAGSMGALRAAELHTLGMIGVGRIFEMYRDGVLEDDDEVAMIHGPESSGYRAASEAMVNLRDRMKGAVQCGVIGNAEADAIVATLKALPYPARTYRRLIEIAASPALEAFVRAPHTSLKERDALALLDRMATGNDRPVDAPLRVERTVFLERLRLEVRRERALGGPARDAAPTARSRALLGLLAEHHASLMGAMPSNDEIQAAVEAFQHARGLPTIEALEAWLDAHRLSADRFVELAREQATLRKLEAVYGAEIDLRLFDQLDWSAKP